MASNDNPFANPFGDTTNDLGSSGAWGGPVPSAAVVSSVNGTSSAVSGVSGSLRVGPRLITRSDPPRAAGRGQTLPAGPRQPPPAPAPARPQDDARLNKREELLNRREDELRRLEMELRSSGGNKSTKNWPPFCPVVHHDIAGEVPAQMQGMVRCGYFAFLVSPTGARAVLQRGRRRGPGAGLRPGGAGESGRQRFCAGTPWPPANPCAPLPPRRAWCSAWPGTS